MPIVVVSNLGRECLLLLIWVYFCVGESLVLESVNGWLNCTLRIEAATVHLPFKNISFRTRTYNGLLPGPVLRAAPGDRVRILLQNHLEENVPGARCRAPFGSVKAVNSSNLHIHGLYDNAVHDNTYVCVNPGDEFLYSYTLRPDMGTSTNFYHPHLHGSSSIQLYGGMAGVFDVVDAKQNQIFGGAKERMLLLQLLDFRPSSKDYIASFMSMDGGSTLPLQLHNPENYTGFLLLVNGEVNPSITAYSRQHVRLKIINAISGSGQSMNLGFVGPAAVVCQLHVLAYDGVYISPPRLQSSVFVPAGGRADVAVLCKKGGIHQIGTLLTGVEEYGNVFPPDHTVITLQVRNDTEENAVTVLPKILPGPPSFYPDLSEVQPQAQHTIMLSTEKGLKVVNGWPYNGSVSHTTTQNSIQEWHLLGGEGQHLEFQHPYHQHMTHFQIVTMSLDSHGLIAAVGDYRDTVPLYRALNYTVRFIPAFAGPMMVHCHILRHEDQGMMTIVNFTSAPLAPLVSFQRMAARGIMKTAAVCLAIFSAALVILRLRCFRGCRRRCQSDYFQL